MNATLLASTGDRFEVSGTADVVAKAAMAYANLIGGSVTIEPIHTDAYWRILDVAQQFFDEDQSRELCNALATIFDLSDPNDDRVTMAVETIAYRMATDLSAFGVKKLSCRSPLEAATALVHAWERHS
jgi:hypothetical protein